MIAKTLVISLFCYGLMGCSASNPDSQLEPQLMTSSGVIAEESSQDEDIVIGTDLGLEIATWNIENFPKGNRTISELARHIKSWQIDVIAVQEIRSVASFQELIDNLGNYDGVLSSNRGNKQKVGVLFNRDEIELVDYKEILRSDENKRAFPRYPLEIELIQKATGRQFKIVSIHLKAKGDSSSKQRRTRANRLMYDFYNDLYAKDQSQQLIILGDYNSDLDDSEMQPWKNDSAYFLGTRKLDDQGAFSFIPSRRRLIDHIVTRNFELQEVLIPQSFHDLDRFDELMSDHLPVVGIAK